MRWAARSRRDDRGDAHRPPRARAGHRPWPAGARRGWRPADRCAARQPGCRHRCAAGRLRGGQRPPVRRPDAGALGGGGPAADGPAGQLRPRRRALRGRVLHRLGWQLSPPRLWAGAGRAAAAGRGGRARRSRPAAGTRARDRRDRAAERTLRHRGGGGGPMGLQSPAMGSGRGGGAAGQAAPRGTPGAARAEAVPMGANDAGRAVAGSRPRCQAAAT